MVVGVYMSVPTRAITSVSVAMRMSEGGVLISYNQGRSFGSVTQTIVLYAMGMANSSLEHTTTRRSFAKQKICEVR